MPGVVQAGAQQIVHCRIDNHERLGRARLHADHLAEQDAGVGDDQPPGFEGEANVPALGDLRHHLPIGLGRGRHGSGGIVGDAEPSAQIRHADAVPRCAQAGDQSADLLEGGARRRKIRQLTTDVNRHALDLEGRQLADLLVSMQRIADRQAELVMRGSRRNLRMGLGDHVGIDPEGNGHAASEALRHARYRLGFFE